MSTEVTAAIIIIGNEILSGRTQDSNINFLAKELSNIGIQLREVRIIPDVEGTIIDCIKILKGQYTYIFTTGGIGPTHDDITSLSVAKALNLKLKLHKDSVKKMEQQYGTKLNEARLKMAMLPEGAEPIKTRVTAAPGFKIENIIVLAGVPKIAEAMFYEILPILKKGRQIKSRFIEAFMGEGDIAKKLESIQRQHPKVEIGSYPFFRNKKVGFSIVARSIDENDVNKVIGLVAEEIKTLGIRPSIDKEIN